ncbi:hypothetical protein CO251_11590 [Sulfobacillus sp. hq2]|nr:hypothetical protein CO251_11590 [Sulfobacillus sp. hq2]
MDQLGDPPSVLSEPDAPVSDNGHRAPDGPEEPTRAHVETPDLLTVWNATALPQIQANPGLLVDADIIALATAIYRTDNLGWYELARGLEGIKGYKAREWKKIIATEAKRQAEAETRAAQQAQRIAASSPSGPLAPVTLPRVEDIWPDAPVRVREWPVPADRRFDAGPQGVARKVGEDPLTGERVMTPITYVPLMIIGGAEPMDTDGEGWLELLWRAGAEWKAVWLPRKQVMSLKNAPDTLNTLNIRIAHDEIKAVLKWLELTEQVGLQAGVWGDQHLTNTLGWKRVQNAWGFMLPEQWIGPALPGGNDHVVFWPKGRGSAGADLFKAHGDIAEESRLLADILAEIPQFAWLMGHGAAAPLHRRLSRLHVTGNLNGYVVELASAQSSTGKTSLTALALSPWRSPYIPIAQYSSAFALEQQLLETNDLPTAIQELQADQKSKVDWSSVVHMIAEKGGRVRGQKTGGYAVAETLHTTLFVANNQSILSMVGDQAGAAARILSLNHIIPQRRLDDPRQSAQLKTLIEGWMARVSQHHGHGGRAMVAVLTTMTDADLLSQYQAAEAVVDQMRAAWPAASGEVAKVLGRQAHAWAMGLLGLRLLLQHGYGWTPQAVAQAEAGYLEAIQQGILPASAFDQQSEAERWWETACSLLNEHAMEFAGLELTDRDGNVIAPRAYRGRYFADEDLIGVLPEWFQGELKRNGRKDFKSIYTEWCRKGWMIRGEEKFTIVKSMKKVGQVAVATRLLCFRASAVGFGVVLPEPNEMHDQAPQAPAPEPPAVIPSVQEEPPTPHELQEPLSPAALVRRLYAKQQRGGAP